MGLIVPTYMATWPSLAVKAIGRQFKKLFITETPADIRKLSDDKQIQPTPKKTWVPSDIAPLHPVIMETVDSVHFDLLEVPMTPSPPSTLRR